MITTYAHVSATQLSFAMLICCVQGKRYLNYDLEALHSHLIRHPLPHVIVAFQDSEAFETGLLTDLILLFRYDQPSHAVYGP